FAAGTTCGKDGDQPLPGTPGLIRIGTGGYAVRIAGMPGGASPSGIGARLAKMESVRTITFDQAGDLFALEGTSLIRSDPRSWMTSTLVSWRAPAFAGENTPLARASFASPSAMAFGPGGDLYLADTDDSAVRRVVGLGRAEPGPSTVTVSVASG